jgi:hypothetical protein
MANKKIKKYLGPYDDGIILLGFVALTIFLQIFVSVRHLIETKGWM